jgi:hypothetical protein
MAISRLENPANQSFIDTYIPPPFQEMKGAIQEKQQEYDTQQNLLNTADKQVKGILPQVSEFYKDTKGRDVANPHAQTLKKYNDLLDQRKQEIYNKYKNDLTSSEAKSEISNFARSAANIYNEVVPDALNTEAAYKESKKRLDERKGTDGGYRLLDFDRSLYNLAEGKTNRLDTSAVSDEHKFEDLDKNFLEGFKADVSDRVGTMINKNLLAKVDFGKKVEELTEKEIGQRYDSFYKTNHLPIVEKSADYDIEHIYQQYKSKDPNISRKQFNESKSIKLEDGKSYTPEEYKKLLVEDDKQRRLNQAKRYGYIKEDKSQSSSFLPGVSYDSEGAVVPSYDERSLQIGGEVTGDQPIDFSKVGGSDITLFNTNNRAVADLYPQYKGKTDPRRYGVLGDPYSTTPIKALEMLEKMKSKSVYKGDLKTQIDEDLKIIKPIADEQRAKEELAKKANKGDIKAIHDYYVETNPVYQNITNAYKSKFNVNNLSREDIKAIQNRANQNLQTIQGNQEVTLNPTFDAEALQNVAGSILNGNAIVKDKTGKIIPLSEVIPDFEDKSPKEITEYLKGGITTYITPIGRKDAGYKLSVGENNYEVTYPNSMAVPELRKFKETTSNIYNVNLPSKAEVTPPATIERSVINALSRNGIKPENIRYISNRDDWNVNQSTLDAEVEYIDPNTGNLTTTTIRIPIFGGKTSVSGLATSVNPQTGLPQDMLKYTIKDSESLKNIPEEKE